MILPLRSLTITDDDYLALWNESRATHKTVPELIVKAVHQYVTGDSRQVHAVSSRPLLERVTVVDSEEY